MTDEMPNHKPYREYRKWFQSHPEQKRLDTLIEIPAGAPQYHVPERVSDDSGLPLIAKALGDENLIRYLTHLPLSTDIINHRQDLLQALVKQEDTFEEVRQLSMAAHNFYNGYQNINTGLKSFASLQHLLDTIDKITDTKGSAELGIIKEFGKEVRESEEYQQTVSFADYLQKTQLIPTIDNAAEFIREYINEKNHDERGSTDRYALADNVAKRRMLTDTFKLLEDTFEDMCERDMVHFETAETARYNKKIKEMARETKDFFPFDKGMSHRDALDANADRISQFISYAKDVLGERFLAKAPAGTSIGSLAERLDTFLTLAKFYKDAEKHGYPVSRPEILPKEDKTFEMEGGVNPLLFATFSDKKKYAITPIDFKLDGDQPIALITGPNNGGKTTLGRHITIEQIMAQAGFYTLSNQTRVSLVDGLLFARSMGDNINDSHGIYKAYLSECMEQLEQATPYSFVFLDELGTGTDTQEGIRISEMVYDFMNTNGIRTLQSSHLTDLAKNAQQGKYEGVNLWGIKADQFGNPSYVPKKNEIGDSNGEFISREVGFTPENLAKLSQNLKLRYERSRESKVA